MPAYGAVEIGGTKTDVAFGTSVDDLSEPTRVPTTTPLETLGKVADLVSSRSLDGVGVACFGPLDLQTATMLSTPKPGWSGAPIGAPLAERLDCDVVVDLDVNGSALGEGRWGAAKGHTNYAYVTVGTGIGAGVIAHGRPVASDGHPEAGHIPIARFDGDAFEGSCPFHGDCLEGMASGPALEARFGKPDNWGAEVVDLAAFYVAQCVRSLKYVAAAQIVVVGGGVSKSPGFHEALRRHVAESLGDYPRAVPPTGLVVAPGLGDLSGLAGALVLAADR